MTNITKQAKILNRVKLRQGHMISPDATFISKNIVYSWDYVFLLVNLDIPNTLNFASEQFYKKDEFHISLFCAEKYFPDISRELVINTVKQIIPNLNFKVTIKNKELYLASKEDKKSILVLADVLGLNEFLNTLSSKLNINIEPFPPHITLYTLENKIGIGIDSQTDFKNYCKKIDLNLQLKPSLQ